MADDRGVRRCNRCGYRGDGLAYFTRPGHQLGLVGLGLVTYGIGALIYWLARRHRLVCPNCGLGWEHSRRLSDPVANAVVRPSRAVGDEHVPLPRGGGFRQALGAMVMIGGLILVGIGLFEFEVAAVITGAVGGLLGLGSAWWGFAARDARREAVRLRLQTRVLRFASRRAGLLTVSDVATEFALSLPAAERILLGMEDGLRVRSEIDPDGVILFEFPEFQRRGEISAPESSPERG